MQKEVHVVIAETQPNEKARERRAKIERSAKAFIRITGATAMDLGDTIQFMYGLVHPSQLDNEFGVAAQAVDIMTKGFEPFTSAVETGELGIEAIHDLIPDPLPLFRDDVIEANPFMQKRKYLRRQNRQVAEEQWQKTNREVEDDIRKFAEETGEDFSEELLRFRLGNKIEQYQTSVWNYLLELLHTVPKDSI